MFEIQYLNCINKKASHANLYANYWGISKNQRNIWNEEETVKNCHCDYKFICNVAYEIIVRSAPWMVSKKR